MMNRKYILPAALSLWFIAINAHAESYSHYEASIKLLEKIGLKYERMIRLSDDEPEIKLYAIG